MEELKKLFTKYAGDLPGEIKEIPCAVSTRRYFRIRKKNGESLVGTYSPDIKETKAFLAYSSYFGSKGIHVPPVKIVSDDLLYYIQEDLGSERFHELVTGREDRKLNPELLAIYKSSITELVKMQSSAGDDLDYSVAVPRPSFDKQAILWDLYHFKYYFLKPSGLAFDENRLETAFLALAEKIENSSTKGFMFRDFQSRNIMLKDGEPWFIDFQGGRYGPLLYDLASLVYESRAELIPEDQEELISWYFEEMKKYREMDEEQGRRELDLLFLIRQLQAIGTYGLRGKVEKKAVFIQSIPHGLENLALLLGRLSSADVDPYFLEVLESLAKTRDSYEKIPAPYDGLTIRISSFSYHKQLPDDLSGNGGGFVYDCRFLENPGLYDEYKDLTGLDAEVQNFLEEKGEVNSFFNTLEVQLSSAVEKYIKRSYKNLMVSFGCTGGQHRSVYMAHRLAEAFRNKPGIRVIEVHRELGREK